MSAIGSCFGQLVRKLEEPIGLDKLGVKYEEWDVGEPLLQEKDPLRFVLSAIPEQEKRRQLWDFAGWGTIDIKQISADDPKYQRKHTHEEAELRVILEGSGIFSIYDGAIVHDINVKKGSYLLIPPNCPHSFRLTKECNIVALRIFQSKNGWVPHYPK